MSAHISEDLPRLLTGEANRDVVLAAAEHLRGCPDCQQELVSAVVAHASLTSAHRFAPEIVSPESGRDEHDHQDRQDEQPAGPLPDMSAMFARVRDEASTAPVKPRRQHRLLAVAAAVVVLAGGGVTIAETVGSSSSTSSSRSIALSGFDRMKPSVQAKVTIVGSHTMRIDATALPRLDSNHSYEVWLTDSARVHMQSVGFIGSDNRGQLTVSPEVMANYRDIEVSVQRTNQTKYSGISVLRGSYRS
jgi:anti-sigma-K factor RskA